MVSPPNDHLSRREREIMDLIYARGEATASDVREDMTSPPSYSAVRGLLRILVEKDLLKHRREGVRNVYEPVRGRRKAGKHAMRRALDTFYAGDLRQAMVALLDVADGDLNAREVTELKRLIERARKEGR